MAIAAFALLGGCREQQESIDTTLVGDTGRVGTNGAPTAAIGSNNATLGNIAASNQLTRDANTATPPTSYAGSPVDGPSPSVTLSQAYVVGRWSVERNCVAPEFTFNVDGTVARGGRDYLWRVEGSSIVVTRVGESEGETTPVRVVNPMHMIVTTGEGPVPLHRC